jgi:hypothetical protein
MKRIGRGLRRSLTYANIAATLALFVAMGGTAAAAVMITNNNQVAQNTISGHQPPSGKHANLISGSVNATDLSPGVKSSFQDQCPVGLSLGRDICYEPNLRTAATQSAALQACENAFLRLPDAGELADVFNYVGAPQPDEWTSMYYLLNGNFEGDTLAYTSSRAVTRGTVLSSVSLAYRCVSNPTN